MTLYDFEFRLFQALNLGLCETFNPISRSFTFVFQPLILREYTPKVTFSCY